MQVFPRLLLCGHTSSHPACVRHHVEGNKKFTLLTCFSLKPDFRLQLQCILKEVESEKENIFVRRQIKPSVVKQLLSVSLTIPVLIRSF